MIYHASYPSAQSVAQPAEGVPAIPGLNPYHQRGIPAAFRLPDDGSQPDGKEDSDDSRDDNIEEQTGLTTGTPEIFRLLLDTDFRMMFEFFMTPGQRDMLEIRSVIRENKNLYGHKLYRPEIMHREKIDWVRNSIYLVTYEFYYAHQVKQLYKTG